MQRQELGPNQLARGAAGRRALRAGKPFLGHQSVSFSVLFCTTIMICMTSWTSRVFLFLPLRTRLPVTAFATAFYVRPR